MSDGRLRIATVESTRTPPYRARALARSSLADYDRRLRQLESRVVASDDDGREFSELIRERTEELIPPDELSALRAEPLDPTILALFEAIHAAAISAKGKR